MFVARTNQSAITPLTMPDPLTGQTLSHRYSYAIPLEIIYTTPLSSWNPYNLKVVTVDPEEEDATRTGGLEPENAYLDTNPDGRFYWTPADFFEEDITQTVGVLDSNGVTRQVRPSGIYTFLPRVQGQNYHIRTRYPIPPIAWNKNYGVMNAKALKHMFETGQSEELVKSALNIQEPDEWIWTSFAKPPVGLHWHRVQITQQMRAQWKLNPSAVLPVTTVRSNNHVHNLKISRQPGKSVSGYVYTLVDCDSNGAKCLDGHHRFCATDLSCE